MLADEGEVLTSRVIPDFTIKLVLSAPIVLLNPKPGIEYLSSSGTGICKSIVELKGALCEAKGQSIKVTFDDDKSLVDFLVQNWVSLDQKIIQDEIQLRGDFLKMGDQVVAQRAILKLLKSVNGICFLEDKKRFLQLVSLGSVSSVVTEKNSVEITNEIVTKNQKYVSIFRLGKIDFDLTLEQYKSALLADFGVRFVPAVSGILGSDTKAYQRVFGAANLPQRYRKGANNATYDEQSKSIYFAPGLLQNQDEALNEMLHEMGAVTLSTKFDGKHKVPYGLTTVGDTLGVVALTHLLDSFMRLEINEK